MIELERFQSKIQLCENGSNFTFRKMSGQYNVAKNSVSTRKKLINSWIREHPKELFFNN